MTNQNKNTTLSSLSHTISYDRRNNSYKPTQGYRGGLSTTYSGLGGGVQFISNILSGAYYYPVADEVTLILRGEAGDLRKVKRALRSADRFSLGANSFRGFEYGEVGPRDREIDPATGNPLRPNSLGKPLGGTRYWTTTAEITFPLGLPSEFGVSGAVFSDLGALWRVGEKAPQAKNGRTFDIEYDKHRMRATVGAGISWDSPFGPISIDYARTVKREKKDQEQRFLFGFSTRY